MSDPWQQNIPPPPDKVAQHLSGGAVHIEGVTAFKDLDADQHHTDIQLLVILEETQDYSA